jgi:hypothetical protein
MTVLREINNHGAPLTRPDGSPLKFVQVTFTLLNLSGAGNDVFDAISGERIIGNATAITDVNGEFSAMLWPNDRGDVATQYACVVNFAGSEQFTSSLASGTGALSWLQFKQAGLPLTPLEVSMLSSYLASLEAQAATALAQANIATAEAASAAADVVLTHADVVLTHADVVLSHADVALTHQDVVLTHDDVATTQGLATVASTAAMGATSAAAALDAALASFRSKWLGSFTTDPLLDGNGNALSVGAEYFNTINNVIRVYTASGWENPDAAALLDMTNAALSAIAAASSASAAGAYSQQAGMYAAAALISEQHAALSATTSTSAANLAAASVLSQLTSLLTQTQAARDAALAGLGAADQSLNLAALSSGLQLALDWAAQANQVSLVSILSQVNTLVVSLTPLSITQTEVMESAIILALDLIGATIKQINSGTVPQLDIAGTKLRIRTAATPVTATATGNQGEWCWDSGYFYVCTATNTWRRAALTAW